MNKAYYLLSLLVVGLMNSCRSDDAIGAETMSRPEVHDKIVEVTRHDGKPFSTGTSAYSKFTALVLKSVKAWGDL